MANAFQDRIGVTTEERVINSFNLGSDVSTRNIGLLVERERGVEGKIILVNNLKEDKRIFGGHNPNMYSSYVVETLFNNTGGYSANVFQSRVVGAGSLSAKTIVKNSSSNTQSMVVETIQNGNTTQPQKDKVTIENVEVGDTFIYTINGSDDVNGASPTTFTKVFTVVATTTNASDVLTSFKTQMDTYFATFVDNFMVTITSNYFIIMGVSGSLFTSTTSTVNEATSESIFEVVAGYQGEQDKGTWGNALRVRVYPIGHSDGSDDGYKMQVFYKGYLVETYISNADDWSSLVNSVNQRSEYVMINPLNLSKALTLGVYDGQLVGGVYKSPVESDYEPRYHAVTEEPLGMAIFEGADVQILACPEVFSVNFARLCEDFARKYLKFFVFNLPYLATESVLQSYYNALFTPDQSFSAGYLNWVEVPADQLGNKIWVPSIGYVLGAGYVKKAGLFNGYVWTPPAGVETASRGIFRITHDNLSEETLSRFVKKWRCNVVKFVKNVGFCVWSSRTYSNNSLFESIHIRLETNWIIANVKLRNEKFIQRVATPTTLKDMRTDNLIWFKNLYEQGGIERSISFEDAIIVSVEQLKENRKEVEMEIAWIPPECIEHIHIKVSRNDGILILNF